MNMKANSFIETINKYLKYMTYEELAEEAGINKITIYRYLNQKPTKVTTMIGILESAKAIIKRQIIEREQVLKNT